MRAFIKYVDERAWRAIVTGWEHPMMINEQKEKSAKEAWTTFQTAYKGTAAVRMSKLQILASRLEDLRMEERETIATFNTKLCDRANEAQALGKKYSDFKLVRKALSHYQRGLHTRSPIEEARDIENMKLDEETKVRMLLFKLKFLKSMSEPEDDDDISESVALLTKNFGKFLKKMNTKPYKPKSGKPSNLQKDKTIFNSSDDRKGRRIQCRECEGFGHVQAEYANTHKMNGQVFDYYLSDEESEGSQEKDKEVHLRNHVALSSKMINSHREHIATSHMYVPTVQYNETCLTSPSFEDIQQMYNKIFQNWLEICKINKSLEEQMIGLTKEHELMKVEILQLTNLVAEKDRKIQEIEQKLFHTQRMMNLDSGKKKLDKILFIGKPCSDHHGLGYTGESSTSKTTLFLYKQKPIFQKQQTCFQKPKPKRFISICHFCNLPGHIQPRCFRFKKALRNGMHFGSPASAILQQKSKLLQQNPKIKIDLKNESKRRIWIRKSDLRAFVADISLKACTNNSWYFDSGYSRHMTSDKDKLKSYQSVNEGHVTFGDDQKGHILGKGKVLHVEGLKTNLISISQLCDQNLFVRFNKDKCQAGDVDNQKSTTGGCFYLGNNMISSEAEYIAAGSCCSQLLWMKQMLEDYGIEQESLYVYCDNSSTINISKNPIQHSRTKHIDIQRTVVIDYVAIEKQLADIFTKPLDEFCCNHIACIIIYACCNNSIAVRTSFA
ncbi:hypothetical protein Pfo_024537 [Paulownia fortunei]|nr:hypothetical protein Pfo_024537 [Paulownia fortunei]